MGSDGNYFSLLLPGGFSPAYQVLPVGRAARSGSPRTPKPVFDADALDTGYTASCFPNLLLLVLCLLWCLFTPSVDRLDCKRY